jgi:hypothetical protein
MPHFFRVLENVKNKESGILGFDRQFVVVMPHRQNINLEFSYIIFALYVRGICNAKLICYFDFCIITMLPLYSQTTKTI